MSFRLRTAAACVLVCFLFGASLAVPASAMTFLTMATGKPGGNYYAFGQVFAQVINASSNKSGIRIKAVPSEGSVANVKGLIAGKYQLALSQADVEHMAWEGEGPWAKAGPQQVLRTIYDIYTEGLACVAAQGAGIKTIADLKGKRVALGTKGSGTMVNAMQALKLSLLRPSDLGEVLLVDPNQAMRMMFDGKLDAFFFMVGHPNATLKKFFQFYGRARLVPMHPSAAMKKAIPFYVNYFIWKSDYPALQNKKSKIDTFGIETFILSTDKVPEQTIYEVARLFFINLGVFKKRLPFMKSIEPPTSGDRKLQTWNVSASYHPGVLKLFKEMGMIMPTASPVQ
ncbi:MAG: TAXI family TRAP transporter solute-binding subunit [Desulfarculaceae bacterium]|nr:TAXI family TRAP transporter solute-binding subunit [Desulfarculaceae bacterium]